MGPTGRTAKRARKGPIGAVKKAPCFFTCDGCTKSGCGFNNGKAQVACQKCGIRHHVDCVEATEDFLYENCTCKKKETEEYGDLEHNDPNLNPDTGLPKGKGSRELIYTKNDKFDGMIRRAV